MHRLFRDVPPPRAIQRRAAKFNWIQDKTYEIRTRTASALVASGKNDTKRDTGTTPLRARLLREITTHLKEGAAKVAAKVAGRNARSSRFPARL